jgi:hypothetical protein
MRPRSLIVDLFPTSPEALHRQETYERVRRTLDDALAELELDTDSEDTTDRAPCN